MNKIEPTELQKRAVNNIVKQKLSKGRVNKKNALLDAGYSPATASVPKIVTETKGFKQAMAEAGLTQENIAAYLSADIVAKPTRRLGELKLASELLGLLEQKVNVTVDEKDQTLELIRSLMDKEDEEN